MEPSYINRPSIVYDPIQQLPRTFFQDIERLGTVLANGDFQDDLTQSLREWHGNFQAASKLEKLDKEKTSNIFLDLLEKILVVPIYGFPLDHEVFLGNDGFSYSRKFLCVDIFNAIPPYNERSPIKRDCPDKFFVKPHEPAIELVRWLKKYRPHFQAEQVEVAYTQIPQDRIPDLPLLMRRVASHRPKRKALSERMQQVQARISATKQAEEKAEEESQLYLAKFTHLVDKVIKAEMAPILAKNQEFFSQAEEKITNLEKALINAIEEEIKACDPIIDNLERDILELKAESKAIGQGIQSVKAEQIKLDIAIRQTEKEIAKRKKRWMKDLISVAISIGLSAAATWGINALLGGVDFNVAINSMRNVTKVTAIKPF